MFYKKWLLLIVFLFSSALVAMAEFPKEPPKLWRVDKFDVQTNKLILKEKELGFFQLCYEYSKLRHARNLWFVKAIEGHHYDLLGDALGKQYDYYKQLGGQKEYASYQTLAQSLLPYKNYCQDCAMGTQIPEHNIDSVLIKCFSSEAQKALKTMAKSKFFFEGYKGTRELSSQEVALELIKEN